MQISAYDKKSLIDFPGKITAVVYSPGCNFSCPGCHAKKILEKTERVQEEEFFRYIRLRRRWIDGVVLLGGEPTLQPEIGDFAEKLKEMCLAVKLDTNGSNPGVMNWLLDQGLIDYIAMDVKGPKDLYSRISGREIDLRAVEEGMRVTATAPDYEYRTTIVPIVRNGEKIEFMSVEEAVRAAEWIVNITGRDDHRYFLQRFVPREEGLLDARLERFPETPLVLLEEMQKNIKEFILNCSIR